MKRIFPILSLLFIFISASAQDAGVKPGDPAPAFSLKNSKDNKMVSLADYKSDKGVILIFTCNHCPYSKMYEDRIIALHNHWAKKGFPVVAINSNDPAVEPEDSYENMKKRAKSKKFPFVYLFDESQDIAHAYGATRTPHVFLLKNTNGTFTVEYIGAIDDSAKDASAVSEKFVEKALQEILEGNEVTMKEAKAVGCTIKWRKS